MSDWNPHVQATVWLVSIASLFALFIYLCVITQGAAALVLVILIILAAFYFLIYQGVTGQL